MQMKMFILLDSCQDKMKRNKNHIITQWKWEMAGKAKDSKEKMISIRNQILIHIYYSVLLTSKKECKLTLETKILIGTQQ